MTVERCGATVAVGATGSGNNEDDEEEVDDNDDSSSNRIRTTRFLIVARDSAAAWQLTLSTPCYGIRPWLIGDGAAASAA